MFAMENRANASPVPGGKRTPKSARDLLRQEIKDLQTLLESKLEALQALERAEAKHSGTSTKSYDYARMRPSKAIRMILERGGEPQTIHDIAEELKAGGNLFGKRAWRAEQNVKVAAEMATDLKVLGDKIVLAEWLKPGGKFQHLASK